jgi:hypothetical protein
LNVQQRQVGLTHSVANSDRKRLTVRYFNQVPFTAGSWLRLTLKFRGFHKSKPVVELHVNENKAGEKPIKDFKSELLRTPRENITISMASTFGRITVSSIPRVSFSSAAPYLWGVGVAKGEVGATLLQKKSTMSITLTTAFFCS